MNRARRRLSRSVARSRWGEYRGLLETARGSGYRAVSLEEWIGSPEPAAAPTLVLRHDVDEHPRSALAMARIEESLGLRSTFYFRWRTAHQAVIGALRERGFAVGLHYETLSRRVLALGLDPEDDLSRLVDESRDVLRREIAAFAERFGPIRSICAHGDSRVPHVRNSLLLRGQDWSSFGIDYEGNEAMAGRDLGCWLTDRSAPEGRWRDGLEPAELFASRTSPILCLTHPNNWASGTGLWMDRGLRTALSLLDPLTGGVRLVRPIRSRTDEPPL
jgi:hypothetical protein